MATKTIKQPLRKKNLGQNHQKAVQFYQVIEFKKFYPMSGGFFHLAMVAMETTKNVFSLDTVPKNNFWEKSSFYLKDNVICAE